MEEDTKIKLLEITKDIFIENGVEKTLNVRSKDDAETFKKSFDHVLACVKAAYDRLE